MIFILFIKKSLIASSYEKILHKKYKDYQTKYYPIIQLIFFSFKASEIDCFMINKE